MPKASNEYSREEEEETLGTSASSCKQRRTGPVRRSKKGGWTPEEDDILRLAVKEFNGKSWKKIAERLPNRTNVQCLHRWQKVLNPDLVKGPWTPEEDEQIKKLVSEHGSENWSLIASHLKGRIGKQCRERWYNHLDPSIKKTPWTEEEIQILMDAQKRMGNKWAEISKLLDGRPNNQCKNMYHSIISKRSKSTTAKKSPPKSISPNQIDGDYSETTSNSAFPSTPGSPSSTVSQSSNISSSRYYDPSEPSGTRIGRVKRTRRDEIIRRGHQRSYSDSAVILNTQTIPFLATNKQVPNQPSTLINFGSGVNVFPPPFLQQQQHPSNGSFSTATKPTSSGASPMTNSPLNQRSLNQSKVWNTNYSPNQVYPHVEHNFPTEYIQSVRIQAQLQSQMEQMKLNTNSPKSAMSQTQDSPSNFGSFAQRPMKVENYDLFPNAFTSEDGSTTISVTESTPLVDDPSPFNNDEKFVPNKRGRSSSMVNPRSKPLERAPYDFFKDDMFTTKEYQESNFDNKTFFDYADDFSTGAFQMKPEPSDLMDDDSPVVSGDQKSHSNQNDPNSEFDFDVVDQTTGSNLDHFLESPGRSRRNFHSRSKSMDPGLFSNRFQPF